jgi:hypothetical protein
LKTDLDGAAEESELQKPSQLETVVPERIDETGQAHATFPPSQLSNFEKCPGFRNRPSAESSNPESAAKGTRIHKALEKDAVDDLKNEEEKGLAQILKDYIDGVIQENLPTLPSIDRREIRLTMDLGGGLKTFGTCDRILIYGTKGRVFDYKTGFREVADAETNAQAWSYSLGSFQKYDYLDEIKFTFLVPQRDEVLSHTFKRSDMPDIRLRLNTIIRRAMAIDWSKPVDPKKLNPQPSLCEWCKYQGTCPALAEKALKIGAALLPGLPVPTSVLVDASRPNDIPLILRLAPLMEEWAKNARQTALKLNMEEGLDIPGFKRIERSTPRAVTSVVGAWEAIKDKIGLDDFLAACAQVSVHQLEQMFADQAKRGGKAKARQDLEIRLRQADVLRDQGKIYYLREKKS